MDKIRKVINEYHHCRKEHGGDKRGDREIGEVGGGKETLEKEERIFFFFLRLQRERRLP